MSGRVAQGRLQGLQIYRLLQCVHENDRVQIEKMVNLGVKNLINLTEPKDGTGVLHVAVSANNQGDGPHLYSVRFYRVFLRKHAPLACSIVINYFLNEVKLGRAQHLKEIALRLRYLKLPKTLIYMSCFLALENNMQKGLW